MNMSAIEDIRAALENVIDTLAMHDIEGALTLELSPPDYLRLQRASAQQYQFPRAYGTKREESFTLMGVLIRDRGRGNY